MTDPRVPRVGTMAGLGLALLGLYLWLSLTLRFVLRLAGLSVDGYVPDTLAAVATGLAAPALLAWLEKRAAPPPAPEPEYDFRRTVGEFTAVTRELFEVPPLAEAFLEAAATSLSPRYQAVLVRTPEGRYEPVAERGLAAAGRMLAQGPQEDDLVIPLKVGDKLVGRLLLGPRDAEKPYGREDLALIDNLAQALALSIRNAQLFRELAEQERVKRELEIAYEVQMGFLPDVVAAPDGAAIATHCTPALEVGGDFFDVVRLDSRHWGVIVGDVSGKGLPAAMMMAVSLTLFRTLAVNGTSPALILTHLNKLIHQHRPSKKLFVSAVYAVYDAETGKVAIANAGQPRPLLNGEEVPAKGLPLGASKATAYKEVEIVLTPGDSLMLYSDGLEDLENAEGEHFGLERIQTRLVEAGREAPSTVLDDLNRILNAFRGVTPPADDLTVALLQRQAPVSGDASPLGQTQNFSVETAKGTRPI